LIRREADAPPELMYALAPEYWGQGLATEAARAVLAHGFEQLQSPRITAASDPPNAASVRVLERLGMRFTHRAALNGLYTVFYEIARPTATGTAPR
jgi:ribosomal-protein-alanine N-acetyltransferase